MDIKYLLFSLILFRTTIVTSSISDYLFVIEVNTESDRNIIKTQLNSTDYKYKIMLKDSISITAI